MQPIVQGKSEARAAGLGFGCSGVMGRVGRRASLAALGAAYDAGIGFYDTARSYGYGESEALLGEFLRGRRERVLVSTKFGILPAAASPMKRALKPLARAVLRVVPGVRNGMRGQLAAMSSGGHFSVAALQRSLEASLRALRTDYVDFLFLHEPAASVVQQDELFAALRELVVVGKVRCFGIAGGPEVADAAIAGKIAGLGCVQVPCNLFGAGAARREMEPGSELVRIGNHAFGGIAGVAAGKARLEALARWAETPAGLREKLRAVDDALLADVVLNAIVCGGGVEMVVASMLRLEHLRANVAAMERSRFSEEEIRWLRRAIAETRA